MRADRRALIMGAGGSLAAPASRPLFAGIRAALLDPLALDIDPRSWRRLAPEALLSRLASAGIDVDEQLRQMLAGGAPNALHVMAAELLRRGGSVWTTNFDELIEAAAAAGSIAYHRLLPHDDPGCTCSLGHLVKPHGTLSGAHVLARSEQLMAPLRPLWLARLRNDLDGAEVGLVGYAGADLDLRTGLRDALTQAGSAVWFGTADDEEPLKLRFDEAIASAKLMLAISARPDLAALRWGQDCGLTSGIPAPLVAKAQLEPALPTPAAQYRPNPLLRARVLDDFGRALEARELYGQALRRGPRRKRAAKALYTSGLIHGAPWRATALRALDLACSIPLGWAWPHRQRLPYLTWNVPPHERLPLLTRSLAQLGDPAILLSAANAAKEVDPRLAAQLAEQAQQHAIEAEDPADLAWATFVLAFARRWQGDLSAASAAARQLADGYDALAGPAWIAWGHFELAAIAALNDQLDDAKAEVGLAIEVFTTAGSIFEFDAWCAAVAIARAAGETEEQTQALERAQELLNAGPLRRRFRREVLLGEEGELARSRGKLDDAESIYAELAQSGTVAQELLGLLGLGEVQRTRNEKPEAAFRALRRSHELGFGYGQVHAAITLGLAGEIDADQAEREIAQSPYTPPIRPNAKGLVRYCQGPDPDEHLICFP